MFYLRLKLIAAVIFLMMAAVLSRTGYMQILRGDFYRAEARRRQISTAYVEAPRGTILARDGTVLAEDLPVRNVCVVLKSLYAMSPEQLQQWYSTVASVAGDTPETVSARVQAVWNQIESDAATLVGEALAKYEPGSQAGLKEAARQARDLRAYQYKLAQPIYADVPFEVAVRAEVASSELDGLAVKESMARKYLPPPGRQHPIAVHSIGYINKITPGEYDLYRHDYLGDERKRVTYDDLIGRVGLEKQYNLELRGSRGKREEVVNVRGRTQKVLSDDPPEPGAVMVLTIDPALQIAAEDALAKIMADPEKPRAGAAVCMDVRSGEILVMASSPVYDPNTIRRAQDLAALTDPNGIGKFHPFQNRAVSALYPLGSVFKVIVATAGLESGAITPDTTFNCEGVFHVGRAEFRCWVMRSNVPPHGPCNLLRGLQVSCNIYFFNAGLKTGGPSLVEWAYGYGFGSPTGIDLPSEAAGNVPTPQFPGEVVNLSIGQGPLLVTPLQVCTMIAAVANGGTLLTPQLRREAGQREVRRVGFSDSTWRTLRKALYTVVNVHGGTGWSNMRSDKIVIAGKTGTAEAPPDGDIDGDHAWVAGFAPSEDPEIAFAVVIEHGGYGGAVAGPVAKAIAEAYAAGKGTVNVAGVDGRSVSR